MGPGKLHIAAVMLLTFSLNCCTCLSKSDTGKNQTQEIARPLPEKPLPEKPLPEKPLPEIPLPPGSANIEALIEDFSEEENFFLCKVKISQVEGYGPATPPLPKGYVMTLEVPKPLFEKNKYDSGKILVRGKLLKMGVRFQDPGPDGTSAERWTATGLRNSGR